MTEIRSLEKLRQVMQDYPYTKPVKKWKEEGKKVIGWVCTYTPEELLHAAGILPIRLVGGEEQLSLELANSYLYPTTCSTVRSYIQMALEKKYDFLDGFIMGGTCDHIRRLYDVWEHQQFTKFNHLIRVPGILNQECEDYYYDELGDMKEALEALTGEKITEDALRNSIGVYNRSRELLAQLHELCKLDDPPVTGAEVLEILNAAYFMPREDYNEILVDLLDEVRDLIGKREETQGKVRLMIYGSELNNPNFIKFLEEQGCVVVLQDTCTGYRYWVDEIAEDKEPFRAIADRYFNHFPCSRIFPRKIRLERVKEIAREYRVDGLVGQYVRYCTPVGWERPLINDLFDTLDIPVMQLEIEYGTGGTGPIKTRIRAFVEMLEEKMLEEWI